MSRQFIPDLNRLWRRGYIDPETAFLCPYCGESGGEPRTVRSREFQGEEGHGGMVEHEDEMCTLCIADQKRREAYLDNLGYVPDEEED